MRLSLMKSATAVAAAVALLGGVVAATNSAQADPIWRHGGSGGGWHGGGGGGWRGGGGGGWRGGGGWHGGDGGWREGGWRGGGWYGRGWGWGGWGWGPVVAFGALAAYPYAYPYPYYNGCWTYRDVWDGYGNYLGRRQVYVCQ